MAMERAEVLLATPKAVETFKRARKASVADLMGWTDERMPSVARRRRYGNTIEEDIWALFSATLQRRSPYGMTSRIFRRNGGTAAGAISRYIGNHAPPSPRSKPYYIPALTSGSASGRKGRSRSKESKKGKDLAHHGDKSFLLLGGKCRLQATLTADVGSLRTSSSACIFPPQHESLLHLQAEGGQTTEGWSQVPYVQS
jgi:hypothetical protein